MTKPKRWFRFRLRTLLLVTLVAACGFGWFGWKLEQARRQKAVLDALALSSMSLGIGYDWDDGHGDRIMGYGDDGWHVSSDWQQDRPEWLIDLLGRDFFHVVNHVYVFGSDEGCLNIVTRLPKLSDISLHESAPIKDDEMMRLSQLTRLRSLTIENTSFSDDSLRGLVQLKTLTGLTLLGTEVGDKGWQRVADIPNLEQLLTDRATDNTLAALVDCKSLWGLFLADSSVTNDGLVHLGQMPTLKNITLSNTSISDGGECLRHLSGLKNLEQLQLSGIPLDDSALVHISLLTNLESLDLSNCGLSDVGLTHLSGLTRLTYLSVYNNDITETAVQDLKTDIPTCRVYY